MSDSVNQQAAGNRHVLIVGASSAIGRALAQQWVRNGSNIILAGRDQEDLNRSAGDLRLRYEVRAEVMPFDALDFAGHDTFWRDCMSRAGGELDGVLMLHAFMPPQAQVQTDLVLARKEIDTNFTSAVMLLTLAANDFEKRRSGFLCVFSSVAGDRGRQSNYLYCSTKAGLTAFLQGLRNRLFKAGVAVVTVKPGFVDTAMTWGLPGLFLVATPRHVAVDVWKAVHKRRNVIYTPWMWRFIMMIIKSIPEFLFKRLKL